MPGDSDIRRVGFARGLRWLAASAELLLAGFRPLAAVAGLWLLVSMIQLVPLIGPPLLAVFTPLLTAGLLVAFDRVAAGRRPRPGVLFAGWHNLRTRLGLIVLGLWVVFGMMLTVMALAAWLGAQVEPGELERAMEDPEALVQLLAGLELGAGVFLALVVMTAVLASLYFSIPLVMFRAWRPVSALWHSLRAVVVNWAAFLGFGIAVMALGLAVVVVMSVVMIPISLALGPPGVFIGQVLTVLAVLFVQVVMAGAQYLAFRDVFGGLHGGEESDPDTGRLVV